jgi:RNA polymerase sigma-70 factor (sigma-E family)
MADSEEFTAFAEARQSALLRLGWALTGDRHLGEDLAQATLDRLWARWPRVSRRGDPWPYAQRVAVSLAATWWRRRWRHVEVVSGELPDAPGDANEIAAADTRDMVERWLATLPRRQRAVIVLRFLADLSVDETAETLHCSPGTVKSQTAKALDRLRALSERPAQVRLE